MSDKMNGINIDNYESYFLLYTDGELDTAGMQAVEAFVALHPELAEELELLLQTRLPADDIQLKDKSFLFRTAAGEINLQNYEEHFLLYTDRELDAAAMEATERFVLQHPEVQAAFTTIKATRLPVETIPFPDKSLLYRKEKTRTVFYMQWQRLAVAAILTGIAVISWWMLPADSSNNTVAPAKTLAGVSPSTRQAAPVAADPLASNSTASNNTVVSQRTTGADQDQVPVTGIKSTETPATDLLAQQVNNPLPAATVVQSRATEATQTAIIESVPAAVASHTDLVPAITAAADTPDASTNTSDIQPVHYRELDTESDDNKKTLLLGSFEINKDKLRGFFRKAGSLFRSKNRTEEDIPDNKTSRSLR
jgi:hypothetical protein